MKLRSATDYSINEYLSDKIAGYHAPLINNKLVFKRKQYGQHTLNFNIIQDNLDDDLPVFDAVFEGQKIQLSSSELSKLLWVELSEKTYSIGSLNNLFRGVAIFTKFVVEKGNDLIGNIDLEALNRALLMTGIENNQFTQRVNAVSYAFFEIINLQDVIHVCSKYSLSIFKSNIKIQNINSAAKKAVEDCTGMSYADYRDAGSFDKLTLEHGRFYIEHVNNIFFDYYLAARTVSDLIALEKAEVGEYARKIYPQVLCGKPLAEIIEYFHDENESYVKNAFSACRDKYHSIYLEHAREHTSYDTQFIKKLCSELGLLDKEQNVACIQALLIAQKEYGFEQYKELFEYTHTRLSRRNKESFLTFSLFEKTIEKVKADYHFDVIPIEKLPEIYEFLRIKDSENKCSSRSLEHYVVSAGCTMMLALFGWRGSEMGFPKSAISVNYNIDALDQAYYPLRYSIKWKVPKTAGETKVDREITQNAFIIASMLQKLNKASDEQPCLYPTKFLEDGVLEENGFLSHPRMANRCAINWESFVFNSVYFKALEQFDAYNQKSDLDSGDKSHLAVLEQTLNSEQLIRQVRRTKEKVQGDWERIAIIGLATKSDEQLAYKVIERYVKNDLDKSTKAIIEQYVSPDILQYIKQLPKGEKYSKNLSEAFADSLKKGCVYPTPHAFRHIWAEAVYRRFSGDIGWFIRSNFKHFSNGFFYRYLKSKDMQHIDKDVKKIFLSSLLFQYIEKKKADGAHDYAGKTEVMLRRIFDNTIVINLEDEEKIKEQLGQFSADELLDIQSSAFGYCIPRRRALEKAACAESGEPQQHLASPEFCFGCQNFLIEQSQVPSAMVAISSHVKALTNHHLPTHFKRSSYKAVNNLMKRLIQLDSNNEALLNQAYIKHLRSALESVKFEEVAA